MLHWFEQSRFCQVSVTPSSPACPHADSPAKSGRRGCSSGSYCELSDDPWKEDNEIVPARVTFVSRPFFKLDLLSAGSLLIPLVGSTTYIVVDIRFLFKAVVALKNRSSL